MTLSRAIELYADPHLWSLDARRAFLLTFPFSGPVWMLGIVLLGVGLAIVGVVQELASVAVRLWSRQ